MSWNDSSGRIVPRFRHRKAPCFEGVRYDRQHGITAASSVRSSPQAAVRPNDFPFPSWLPDVTSLRDCPSRWRGGPRGRSHPGTIRRPPDVDAFPLSTVCPPLASQLASSIAGGPAADWPSRANYLAGHCLGGLRTNQRRPCRTRADVLPAVWRILSGRVSRQPEGFSFRGQQRREHGRGAVGRFDLLFHDVGRVFLPSWGLVERHTAVRRGLAIDDRSPRVAQTHADATGRDRPGRHAANRPLGSDNRAIRFPATFPR